jgi:hypothetical protein
MKINNVDASYTVTATFTREELHRAHVEMKEFTALPVEDRSYPEATFDIVQALVTDTFLSD